MSRLVIREQAQRDIDEIVDRIALDSPRAALRIFDAIYQSFEFLIRWPRVGTRRGTRDRALQGLRSYPIPRFRDYLVFYLPLDDGIEIVHVIHGARDIPTVLGQS